MTNPAIDKLARAIAELQEAVKERAPQLIYSSLEDGALREHDRDGALVGQYGKQYDGTSGAAAFNGPQPPTPTTPIVAAGLSSLVVTWDGLWVDADAAPMNFARVEVHASTNPDFDPSFADTLVGTIETPRGGPVVVSTGLDFSDHYVYLLARTTSGIIGPRSARAVGKPDASIQVALGAANGKNKVTFATDDPGPDDAGIVGDLWYRQNPVTQVTISTWACGGGTAGAYVWSQIVLDDENFASVNAGKIVSGYLDVGVEIGVGSSSGDHSIIGGTGMKTIMQVQSPTTVLAVVAVGTDPVGTVFNGSNLVDYAVTSVTANGESMPSPWSAQLTPGLNAGEYVSLAWPTAPGAATYNVYRRNNTTGTIRRIATGLVDPVASDGGYSSPPLANPPTQSFAGAVVVFDSTAGGLVVGGTLVGRYRSAADESGSYIIDGRGFFKPDGLSDRFPMSVRMDKPTLTSRRTVLSTGAPNPSTRRGAALQALYDSATGLGAVTVLADQLAFNGFSLTDVTDYNATPQNLTLGTGGTAQGWYIRQGRLVYAFGAVTLGSGFSGPNRWGMRLPFPASTDARDQLMGTCHCNPDGAVNHHLAGILAQADTTSYVWPMVLPASGAFVTPIGGGINPGGVTWTTGGFVRWQATYIAADPVTSVVP